MQSTINDPKPVPQQCSCGCLTLDLKTHKKSRRHRYFQAKSDRAKVVSLGDNDNIILNHFLLYDTHAQPKNRRSQIYTSPKRAVKYIHLLNISYMLEFD